LTPLLQVSHLSIREHKRRERKEAMDKRKDHGAVDELSSELQFHKLDVINLPFLCEKSEAIALVLLGLTAGWLAGRQNSAEFKNF